jgi:acetyltransferase-like isoleucine patch superfamily enzyme
MKILNKIMYFLLKYPYYKIVFAKIGKKSWLVSSKIDGYKNISIGDNVYINSGGWLASVNAFEHNTILEIGSGTYIGRNCHIYATKAIKIGEKVLIADNVYITDNLHEYQDPSIPIIEQPLKQLNMVTIGVGAWIGEKVSIIGASVGKNAVIGANSVVTKNIPDYCVAVGAPARVIKKYDLNKHVWENVNAIEL